MEVKEIIHEVDKPNRDPHARSVAISFEGKDILFRSERPGWGPYYQYEGNGKLENVMTTGERESGQLASIDTMGRTVYENGFGREIDINPSSYMLYKVHIGREGVTPLSPEDGQHQVKFLKSNRYYFDTYSRVDLEPKIMLKDNKVQGILEVAKPDIEVAYKAGWK